jgi:hypothetical protein
MTSLPADDFASTLPQSDPPRRLHNLPKASNFSGALLPEPVAVVLVDDPVEDAVLSRRSSSCRVGMA